MTHELGDTVYIGKPSPDKMRWKIVQIFATGQLKIQADRGVGGRAPRTRIVTAGQITPR